MYETMAAWETDPTLAAKSEVTREFAQIWQAAEKIVYSKTLERPFIGETRVERDFEPEAVRRIKASAASDLTVGGPELASQALKSGLVDECHLFVAHRRDCWSSADSAVASSTSGIRSPQTEKFRSSSLRRLSRREGGADPEAGADVRARST
jgi:riboflavin biosynthesis pyrimidine reductase